MHIFHSSFVFYILLLNVKSLGTRYESINFLLIALTKSHKVRWDDWSRADGTKTTWDDGSNISTNLWNSAQRRIRQKKLENDASLDIKILHTTDIHNTLTYLRNQGALQTSKRSKKEPQPNFLEEMNKNIVFHQEIGNLPASDTVTTSKTQRSSTRQKTATPLARSSSSAFLSSRSIQSSTATSSVASATLEPSPRSSEIRLPMKRCRKRVDSSDSDTLIGPSIRPSHRPVSPTASQSRPVPVIERFHTPVMRLVVSLPYFFLQYVKTSYSPIVHRRMELQNNWSRKAEKWGAAPISFCNDVDDEAIPPISPNFCYLEANYKL